MLIEMDRKPPRLCNSSLTPIEGLLPLADTEPHVYITHESEGVLWDTHPILFRTLRSLKIS